MRATLAIARREVVSFFVTPRGYLFLVSFCALCGFYFFNILGRFNFLVSRTAGMQLDVGTSLPTLHEFVVVPYFHLLVVTLVVFVPLITMRAWAEERRAGTYELLRTSPISLEALVWGKFLAAMFLSTLLLVGGAAFLGALIMYGSPDRGSIAAGLLGIFLCAIFFVALSLFLSSRTDHQLTAAVLSGCALALLALLHTLAPIVPGWGSIINGLAPLNWIDAFAHGLVSVGGLLFFGIGALVALVGCVISLRFEHAAESSHASVLPGFQPRLLGALGLMLLIVGVGFAQVYESWFESVVVLQLLLGTLAVSWSIVVALRGRTGRSSGIQRVSAPFDSSRVIRACVVVGTAVAAATVTGLLGEKWDWSDRGNHTLSEFSRSALRSLSQPLTISFFSTRDEQTDRVVKYELEKIARANPAQIRAEIVDAVRFPNLVESYGVRAGVQVVVRYGEGGSTKIARLRSINEESVVAAALSLSEVKPKRVLLIVGTGLPTPADDGSLGITKFARALTSENVDVEGVNSSDGFRIDPGTEAVMLLGVRTPIAQANLDQMLAYLRGGGRIFLSLDPVTAPLAEPVLTELGVSSAGAIVLDRDQILYTQGALGLQPLVTHFAEHPITNQLDRSKVVIMNGVTPLSVLESAAVVPQPLCFASPGSVFEPRALEVLNGTLLPSTTGDPMAPALPLAFAVSTASGQPRAVVVGDTDWILNGAFDYYSNRAFALNSMHWLLGNSWALKQRTKTVYTEAVALSVAQFRSLVVLTAVGLEVMLFLGIALVARRGTAAGR